MLHIGGWQARGPEFGCRTQEHRSARKSITVDGWSAQRCSTAAAAAAAVCSLPSWCFESPPPPSSLFTKQRNRSSKQAITAEEPGRRENNTIARAKHNPPLRRGFAACMMTFRSSQLKQLFFRDVASCSFLPSCVPSSRWAAGSFSLPVVVSNLSLWVSNELPSAELKMLFGFGTFFFMKCEYRTYNTSIEMLFFQC